MGTNVNAGSVRRSEAILNRLVTAGEISEAGKQWLIAAFDPYHDGPIDCSGYPDSNGQNSVVQCVTKTVTITSGSSSNWDCHIVDFPFLGPDTSVKPFYFAYTAPGDSTGAVTPGAFSQANGTILNCPMGGFVTMNFETSANNVNVFSNTNISGEVNTLNIPFEYLQNPYRIIAKGWEIYNTSTELYKGGSILTYNQPVSNYQTASTVQVAGLETPYYGYVSACLMQIPPKTLGEAMLLTGSRQWEAKEGAYVIPKIHSRDIPTNLGNYVQPLYYSNTPGDTNWIAPGFNANTPFNGLFPANMNWTEFDQAGVIVSGLVPEAALTLNVRWFIETFPTSGSVLQTLARPSPLLDPNAMNLYAELSHRSPISVEVKYNGFGDWFNEAVSAVQSVAMPVMKTMLPGGVGKLAGAMAGAKKKKKK